jgi:signal transduction histidine kinase
MLLFSLVTTSFSMLAVYVLLKRLRRAAGKVREQLRWIILGILVMLGLIIFTILLPLMLFKTSSFVSLMPLYTAIFIAMTAYAIIRHNFLDVRLLVARSIAYSVVAVILVLTYSGSIFLVGTYVIGYEIRPVNMLISVIFAFIIAISYEPLLRNIERLTDRLFFKDRYDSRFLLAKLGRIMASTLELKELTQLILKTLLKDMKVSKGYLLLTRENQIIWSHGQGYYHITQHNFVGDYINFLITSALKKKNDDILLFEELPDGPEKDIMREYEMSVAYPLLVEGKPIGLMWFGSKLSGETYSTEDMHLFKIFAPEVAVAINNSLQYDEIKQFNITLQEKIKQATSNLRTANHKLKELDKMKDDFVSVASHELRTPMTAIKSYLWLALAGKGGKLSAKQQYYLQRSYNSVDRLIKLVNDMLNISRIESGRIFISLAKTDIVSLIEEVIEEIKPRIDELKIKIAFDFSSNGVLSKEKVGEVIADSDKIKEVVLNLIGNSLKFTEEGGTISVSFTKDEGRIITRVKDSGRGIDKKDMPTLFTKFGMIQGSYATNKKASGTGLGLYISKSIIELHNGEMKAESEGLGKGSTFSFSVPVYSQSLLKKMSDKLNTGNRDQTIGIIHTSI